MSLGGVARRAAVVLTLGAGAAMAAAADFGRAVASAEALQVAQWATGARDAGGRPFAIVDKRDARIFVFDADARLVGESPALLGQARGDHSAPGVGLLEPETIPLADRTTPAGRFVSEPGTNLEGEHVVWVDYDAGIAIHRVRPGPARERREHRLATPTPDDNRASLGCIVVPAAFYDNVVRPVLGARYGVVYVLPETRPAHEVFGATALARGD